MRARKILGRLLFWLIRALFIRFYQNLSSNLWALKYWKEKVRLANNQVLEKEIGIGVNNIRNAFYNGLEYGG
ncbi:MAG: hypothetical protein QXG31_00410 [Candidatus Bathyarchaeia archaeon]